MPYARQYIVAPEALLTQGPHPPVFVHSNDPAWSKQLLCTGSSTSWGSVVQTFSPAINRLRGQPDNKIYGSATAWLYLLAEKQAHAAPQRCPAGSEVFTCQGVKVKHAWWPGWKQARCACRVCYRTTWLQPNYNNCMPVRLMTGCLTCIWYDCIS